jgi:hypothetical protein
MYKGRYLLSTLSTECTPLDVQHEIAATYVLHDKVYAGLCLKTGVQTEQKGVSLLIGNQEHSLLGPRALHLIVLNDEFLFQHFDGIQLFRALGLSKHDLSEVTLSEHSKEVEMIEPNSLSCALRICWRGHLVLIGICCRQLRDLFRW